MAPLEKSRAIARSCSASSPFAKATITLESKSSMLLAVQDFVNALADVFASRPQMYGLHEPQSLFLRLARVRAHTLAQHLADGFFLASRDHFSKLERFLIHVFHEHVHHSNHHTKEV